MNVGNSIMLSYTASTHFGPKSLTIGREYTPSIDPESSEVVRLAGQMWTEYSVTGPPLLKNRDERYIMVRGSRRSERVVPDLTCGRRFTNERTNRETASQSAAGNRTAKRRSRIREPTAPARSSRISDFIRRKPARRMSGVIR